MNKEELIIKVLSASNTQLDEIEKVLNGKITPQDCKLLNYLQASEILGVSRTTVRRLANEGRLKTVITRLGRKRVLSQSITDFVSGAIPA